MSNKTKILIAVLLMVILLFVCIVIGKRSYAKSISHIKGEGDAKIARWNFKVNGEEEQMKTVNLQSTNKQNSLAEGKIAPGTSGFFEIIIDSSEAEISVDYQISFINETPKPTNLIFKCEGIESRTLKDLESALKGSIDINDEEKIKIYTIEWEWSYETGNDPQTIRINDEIDTREGAELSNYKFDITVTGTQKNLN